MVNTKNEFLLSLNSFAQELQNYLVNSGLPCLSDNSRYMSQLLVSHDIREIKDIYDMLPQYLKLPEKRQYILSETINGYLYQTVLSLTAEEYKLFKRLEYDLKIETYTPKEVVAINRYIKRKNSEAPVVVNHSFVKFSGNRITLTPIRDNTYYKLSIEEYYFGKKSCINEEHYCFEWDTELGFIDEYGKNIYTDDIESYYEGGYVIVDKDGEIIELDTILDMAVFNGD